MLFWKRDPQEQDDVQRQAIAGDSQALKQPIVDGDSQQRAEVVFQDHDDSQVMLLKNAADASNSVTDISAKTGRRAKKVNVTLARNARNYDLEKSVSFETPPVQQPVAVQASNEDATQKVQDNSDTIAGLFDAYTNKDDLLRLDAVKPMEKAQSV